MNLYKVLLIQIVVSAILILVTFILGRAKGWNMEKVALWQIIGVFIIYVLGLIYALAFNHK